MKVYKRGDAIHTNFAEGDVVPSGTAMVFDGNPNFGIYNFDGSTDVTLTYTVVLADAPATPDTPSTPDTPAKSAQSLCSTLAAALGVTAILNLF